eukprot:CAMPEP_0174995808 /NCGR_PEP_ID=MMETSP0005-20121125/40_1 /TAXON_ID=420556 /ORGANISM="Ochromonas sp., Strain CCMP1393" /LENGTH=515 /DNA_ID=CAMNT_0016250137 /DNA_START=362 /DNA_END=1909 /DNA_ORIENTATION=-
MAHTSVSTGGENSKEFAALIDFRSKSGVDFSIHDTFLPLLSEREANLRHQETSSLILYKLSRRHHSGKANQTRGGSIFVLIPGALQSFEMFLSGGTSSIAYDLVSTGAEVWLVNKTIPSRLAWFAKRGESDPRSNHTILPQYSRDKSSASSSLLSTGDFWIISQYVLKAQQQRSRNRNNPNQGLERNDDFTGLTWLGHSTGCTAILNAVTAGGDASQQAAASSAITGSNASIGTAVIAAQTHNTGREGGQRTYAPNPSRERNGMSSSDNSVSIDNTAITTNNNDNASNNDSDDNSSRTAAMSMEIRQATKRIVFLSPVLSLHVPWTQQWLLRPSHKEKLKEPTPTTVKTTTYSSSSYRHNCSGGGGGGGGGGDRTPNPKATKSSKDSRSSSSNSSAGTSVSKSATKPSKQTPAAVAAAAAVVAMNDAAAAAAAGSASVTSTTTMAADTASMESLTLEMKSLSRTNAELNKKVAEMAKEFTRASEELNRFKSNESNMSKQLKSLGVQIAKIQKALD